MVDEKSVKEALKNMFQSGELSVEVFKPVKECKGDWDNYKVQVKIDNEVVCEKGTIVIKQI